MSLKTVKKTQILAQPNAQKLYIFVKAIVRAEALCENKMCVKISLTEVHAKIYPLKLVVSK